MGFISIQKDRFDKVLKDVEVLVEDVSSLMDIDKIAEKRLEEVKKDPSIGIKETDLDKYLEKRGVKLG